MGISTLITIGHALWMGLAGITLLGHLGVLVEFCWGNGQINQLVDIPPTLPPNLSNEQWPRVSVIVPARNEARHIETALRSLLQQDYPGYELIVLNDRSEDETGDILARMGQQYPQLKVINITRLPEGWLGKNHALWLGAQQAQGDWLLFADADVVMEPTVLKRAVRYVTDQVVDHLAVWPALLGRSLPLNLFLGAFSVYFSLYSRPWHVRNPKQKAFIGIGAFNLIRKSVYQAIGTHAAIALRPDDDMKLGKLVKKSGFRQDVCSGRSLVAVEWYVSLNELIQGLMKNAFAGLEYSVFQVISGTLAQFLFGVWPLLGFLLSSGWIQVIYGLSLLCLLSTCWQQSVRYKLSPVMGLAFPLSTLLMIFIIWRATLLNLWQGGIYWRNTFYPLPLLRKNQV